MLTSSHASVVVWVWGEMGIRRYCGGISSLLYVLINFGLLSKGQVVLIIINLKGIVTQTLKYL